MNASSPASSPLAETVGVSAPATSPALPQALPSAAPPLPPSGLPDAAFFTWGGYFEALAWLCFALALFWCVLWLIKKRGGLALPGASAALRIESRLALGPKKWIMTVRVQERRLLLGVTDQQISLLCELPDDEALPSRKSPSFASLLYEKKDASDVSP